jgi:hypothetical protein
VRIPTEARPDADCPLNASGRRSQTTLLAWLVLALAGCGEPSLRELENRRELEALLTAISLKNKNELERDIKRIEGRHTSGALSDASFEDLHGIIKKAQTGDWAGAEKQAYELRESKPYFK